MTWLDIFFVVLGVALVANGVWKGGVRMVFGLLSLVAAYLFAGYAAPPLASKLSFLPETFRHAAAVTAGFLLIFTAGVLAGMLANKLVNAAGLSPINRALGAVFGFVICAYLAGGLVRVAPRLAPSFQKTVQRSSVVKTLASCALFTERLLPVPPFHHSTPRQLPETATNGDKT